MNEKITEEFNIKTEPEYYMSEADVIALLKTGELDALLDAIDFEPAGIIDLIKKYSTVLGWDWRMLAASIYKESRFSVAAKSSRGAKGLMQVRDFTAQSYGVENRLDPEQNIYAGVRFLSEIQSRYLRSGLDSVNSLKFTLAAYNAGESRIGDCIRFTHEQGGNSANWESVSRYIPMMSLPEYYQNAEYLNHGSFNGSETIQYVDDVASIYEEYLFLVKK